MIGLNSHFLLKRRSLPMFGLMLCLANGRSASGQSAPWPVVAWGDSLTQGGYPALAGALFTPPRSIVNRGIGGQSAHAIAARQGARPITVTVAGNTIPARQDTVMSWDFEASSTAWYGIGSAISRSGGRLHAAVTGTPQGAAIALGQTLLQGRMFTVEFDIVVPAGMTVRCSALNTGVWAANNGSGTNGFDVTSSGHYKVALYTGNVNGNPATATTLCFLTSGTAVAGTFSIDNVVLTIPVTASDYAVTITAKNINILTQASTFAGTSAGTLAGVHGIMSTDSSGNWTFTRDTTGPAVSCPAGSLFIPDDATTYKDHTAWIWTGNNGVADEATAAAAKSDIAAMAAWLGHNRYLVGSILTSADHTAERIALLQRLNADLLGLYGNRFVDIYSALRSSGNGSADDNTDIAAGYVPRSLRNDGIHLNAAGNAVAAREMYQAMRRMRW